MALYFNSWFPLLILTAILGFTVKRDRTFLFNIHDPTRLVRDTRRQSPNCNTRFVSQAELRCAHLLAIFIGNSYSCHRRIPTNAPFIFMRNFKQHCGADDLSQCTPFFCYRKQCGQLYNGTHLRLRHAFFSRKTSSLRFTSSWSFWRLIGTLVP